MQVSPKSGKPYVIIAQLYAESSDQFDGTIAKKAVFWAAVDKCRKAMRIDPSIYEEANALVVEYEKRFPTPEELFFEEYEWGKSYSVGGWIGESTIIRYYGKDGVEPKY